MTAAAVAAGLSGVRAAELAGITYRQLDYWARTDLVRPSIAEAHGSGSHRLYAYSDLIELSVARLLRDAGIALDRVRGVVQELRWLAVEDFTAVTLVVDGRSVAVAEDDRRLLELVRAGEGVLTVISLGACLAEMDARLAAGTAAVSEGPGAQ